MFTRQVTNEEIIYINALMEEESMRYTWGSEVERQHFVNVRKLTGGWNAKNAMPADYGKPSNPTEVAEYISKEYISYRACQEYCAEQERKRREAAKTPEQREHERAKRRLREHERAIEKLTAEIERLTNELAHHQNRAEEYREKVEKGA